MPPRKKTSKPQPVRQTRRSARQNPRFEDAIPKVYNEMLAQVERDERSVYASSSRPTKRRKVSEEPDTDVDALFVSPPVEVPTTARSTTPPIELDSKPQQVVYDDFAASDESDVEFEDVDLDAPVEDHFSEDEQPEQKPLQLDLSKAPQVTPKRSVQRRKPVTKAERDFRLDVHKWHVMFLLLHGLERSIWCDREQVHVLLKKLIPRKVINLLHVDESKPSYQRNHAFTKGIEEVCVIWRSRWDVNVQGLRRAQWKDEVDAQKEFDDAEDPIDFEDFVTAAQTCRGSRDLGAQLFCALLRSLALETRLIFSLQALPLGGVAKGQTPEKPKQAYINAPSQVYGANQSSKGASRKKIRDSPYPVFWVEVLNPATTTWIPLDPIVRNSINKPKTQFEPPASDNLNGMTYVLAFEDDHTVHDVTRRYTQWYNAKTRKQRIESTKGGEDWWRRAMKVFRRSLLLSKDQVESEQLARRHAAEGMPKNVVDFKSHPVYVLERHLRMNEVIHPMREVGKFSTGHGRNTKVESVYRREDVHVCRTADAWYRRGRDVKVGQQPLKRVVPKVKQDQRATSFGAGDDDEDGEGREGVAMYAEYQTQLYEPPPVMGGKIPRNAYGNLDVYVPSMIPAGAVHLSHPLAAQAARLLAVDYADAVTGFNFKGRQGTAVINGVVVAMEYTAALTATIESLEWQGTQEVQLARSKIVLGLWKRMLTALRVYQRIEREYGEKAEDSKNDMYEHSEEDEHSEEEEEEEDDEDSTYADEGDDSGGGFMLDAEENKEKVEEQALDLQALKNNLPTTLPDEVVQHPIRIFRSPHKPPVAEPAQDHVSQPDPDDLFGDSDVDEMGDSGGGGFFTEDHAETTENAVSPGGFIPDDANVDYGGGFIPDKDEDEDRDQSKHDIKDRNIVSHDTNPNDIPTITVNDSEGGGFLLDDDDENDNSYNDNDNDKHSRQEKEDENGDEKEISNSNLDLDSPRSTAASTTSLLSHDPDDDLEPDWIEEALESD